VRQRLSCTRCDLWQRPPEDAGDLEGAPDATAADLVRPQRADLFTQEEDQAGIVANVAGDEVEQRRLPRSVRPDDRSQVTTRNHEIDAVHGAQPAEALHERLGLEDYLAIDGRSRHARLSRSPTNPWGSTTITAITMATPASLSWLHARSPTPRGRLYRVALGAARLP
jgi:hypothetical protein